MNRARAVASRAPRLSGGEAEQLVLDALRQAREAEGGGEGRADQVILLRMRLRDLTSESFPPPGEVARYVAASFLSAARAFTSAAAAPETRTACAPLLREAATLLDRHLTLHRTAQADTWRNRIERD